MAILLAVVLLLLCAVPVAADELWVRNEGGLEISIWSDTDWTDVDVAASFYAVGPSWEPEDGKAKVAAVTVPGPEWVVIAAENITRWEVELACNQRFEDVEPVVQLVTEPEKSTSGPAWAIYVWDWMLYAFRLR
jgi:hypothetical protein